MKKNILICFIALMFVVAGCANGNQESQNESNAETESSEGSSQASESGDYPEKQIEMIIPFSAGGSTDTAARTLANAAQEYLPNNTKIVPVNQPGGGGSVGMTQLLNAKPDGYTIAFANSDALAVQPAWGEVNYMPDSFQPVLKAASSPWVLAVRNDAPWDDFEEWLAYVKENPGEFTYGSAFVGSPGQIAIESLGKKEGYETQHVPYDGGSGVATALLGGNIDGAMIIPSTLLPHYESGDIKVLASFGTESMEEFGGVPTVQELGYDEVMELTYGIAVPEDTDQEVQITIHDAFEKAIEDPEVTESLSSLTISPDYATGEEYQSEVMDVYNLFVDVMTDIELIE